MISLSTRLGASFLALGLALPAGAQVAPAPSQPAPAAPLTVQPVPPAPVRPTLSPQQAELVARLVEENGLAQGLRRVADQPRPMPVSSGALVDLVLDHARAVHSGRLSEADFDENWALRPPAYDPLPSFARAVQEDRIAEWFRDLPPPWAGYEGLKTGLATYRAIAAAGGWKAIPAGADMTVGATGARVAALRQRLAIEDKAVAATGDRFDADLKAAVERAQRRYGVPATGTVSTMTLAALNVPVEQRVRQIMANMERWRWLPHELPKDRIQVNIATAVVTVFEGDQPVMSMRGVTGKPGTETPMLSSTIHSIVLNPPWNVPARIARDELFPKGPAYLKANGFRVVGEGANRRLVQAAGPNAALGRFKFDFQNDFAVFLHDTPAQAGFARFDRLASHGCVRLERPRELAEYLLRSTPEWQPDAVQRTLDSGKTVRATLARPAEVYLLYWTAFASSNGAINFRGDPYGWDEMLADKIETRSAARIAAR